MTHDEHPQLETHPQQNKSVFFVRVVRVKELNSPFITKCRPCLIEGDAMLFEIGLFFRGVPLESKRFHTYNVHTQ